MNEPSVWQWSKETIRANWKWLIMIVFFSVLLGIANAIQPLLWQRLVDEAAAGSVNQTLTSILILMILLRTVPIVYTLKARFLNRYDFITRFQLFKHVLRLSMPFHKDKKSTKVMLEANKGVSAGRSLLKTFLSGSILADIPLAIFSFWFIAIHSLLAFSILVLFLLLFLGLSNWLGRRMAKLEEEYNEIDNEVSARSREVLQQIEAVKLHRGEQQEYGWFLKNGGQVFELDNRRILYHACFQVVASLAWVLPSALALLIFLPQVASGQLTIGMLFALQMYAMDAVSPAGFLGDMYQEIKTLAAKLKPALRLLAQQPTVVEAQPAVEMSPLRFQIQLHNLTFQYPDANQPVLKDISLTIAAGEKVAIVGKTGSGKSTLVRLMARQYDPTRGLITMDGTDLRQISFASLYGQLSFVTQEVPIFSGTIAENVGYGLNDIKNEHIVAACTNASASFVLQKEEGLNTKVGELGENLSGGQRQRLALARVFLRHPSVVILDEATSALDHGTEREVQESFDRLLKMNGGTTMIVIAHRITTVKNSNRIVVLDQGRIADSGTHSELLSRCELYQSLCQGMAE